MRAESSTEVTFWMRSAKSWVGMYSSPVSSTSQAPACSKSYFDQSINQLHGSSVVLGVSKEILYLACSSA